MVIKDRSAEPDVLARQTFDFAKHIMHRFDVKIVVIMELLERTGRGRYATSSVSEFRTAANKFNNEMKDLVLEQSDDERVYFWHHRGLVQDSHKFIGDGCHLTDEGMKKYFKSVRRCVLQHSSKIK